MTDKTLGTLLETEFHPAALPALEYVKEILSNPLWNAHLRESFASTALASNRLSEVCFETMERILTGQPISDRYLLGLAWTIKSFEERGMFSRPFVK